MSLTALVRAPLPGPQADKPSPSHFRPFPSLSVFSLPSIFLKYLRKNTARYYSFTYDLCPPFQYEVLEVTGLISVVHLFSSSTQSIVWYRWGTQYTFVPFMCAYNFIVIIFLILMWTRKKCMQSLHYLVYGNHCFKKETEESFVAQIRAQLTEAGIWSGILYCTWFWIAGVRVRFLRSDSRLHWLDYWLRDNTHS